MFKVGDYVTWKAFIGRPLERQIGAYWHGPGRRPQGYKVVGVEGFLIEVETHNPEFPTKKSGFGDFEKIKPKLNRNLPSWW